MFTNIKIIFCVVLDMRNLVGCRAKDQDAEDEQHGEPDLAEHRGVALNFVQQAAQYIPITHLTSCPEF